MTINIIHGATTSQDKLLGRQRVPVASDSPLKLFLPCPLLASACRLLCPRVTTGSQSQPCRLLSPRFCRALGRQRFRDPLALRVFRRCPPLLPLLLLPFPAPRPPLQRLPPRPWLLLLRRLLLSSIVSTLLVSADVADLVLLDKYIAPRDPTHIRWYIVTAGRRVGIWHEWVDMAMYVTRVPGNLHRSFDTCAEAEAHYYGNKALGQVEVIAP